MGIEESKEPELTIEDAFDAFKNKAVGAERDKDLLGEKAVQDLLEAGGVSMTINRTGGIKYKIPPDENFHDASTWRSVVFTLQAAASKFPKDIELTVALAKIADFFNRVAGCDAICIARNIREER
jgi:hypothetical protein